MERQKELELEKEREKRVAHLHQSAMRRIKSMEISRAWNAWDDWYQSRTRFMRLLKGGAARLAKPKLGQAFQHWQRVSFAERILNESMSEQEKLKAEITRHGAIEAQLQNEVQSLKLELIAAREAALAGTAGDGDEAPDEREARAGEAEAR